jgi:hypothetical protein
MTTTTDPSTSPIHQQPDHRLDPNDTGRSHKQSPNRAGIPMLRGARPHRAQGSNDCRAMSQIGPCVCDRRGF